MRYDEPALAQLHATLRAVGATVAVAESLTGGLVCAALTSTAGASATVRGGLVVYATELKALLAGVDPDVAVALARGARERLGASIGIGVTGVAGPDPQDGKSVGTVYVAACTALSGHVEQWHLDGDRAAVRAGAVELCLDLLTDLAEELADELA